MRQWRGIVLRCVRGVGWALSLELLERGRGSLCRLPSWFAGCKAGAGDTLLDATESRDLAREIQTTKRMGKPSSTNPMRRSARLCGETRGGFVRWLVVGLLAVGAMAR